MSKRNTRPKILERQRRVEMLLTRLVPHYEIVRIVMEEFGVAEITAERDIVFVADRMERAHTEGRGKRKHSLRASLQALYRAARRDKDHKAAVAAARELAKLDGLYAPTEISFEGTATVTTPTVTPQPTSAQERANLQDVLRQLSAALKPSGT